MFVASNKLTQFFKQNNVLRFYDSMTVGHPGKDGLTEHGLERLFGYIFDYLGMKVRVIGHHKLPVIK